MRNDYIPENLTESQIQIIKTKDRLWDQMMADSLALNNACKNHRGSMGLISEEFAKSEEFKRLNAKYEESASAHKALCGKNYALINKVSRARTRHQRFGA